MLVDVAVNEQASKCRISAKGAAGEDRHAFGQFYAAKNPCATIFVCSMRDFNCTPLTQIFTKRVGSGRSLENKAKSLQSCLQYPNFFRCL